LTAATTVIGGVGVAFALVPFISSMQPSAKARAAGAPVRADISKLEPGQMIRVKWRGKPVWIVNRTQAMLATLPTLDSQLRDPSPRNRNSPTMPKTSTVPSSRVSGADRHLHPSGLSPTFARTSRRPIWARTGRVASSVPATVPASIWPVGYSGRAGAAEPAGAAAPLPERDRDPDR
jgi:ubiquinol-cytochrome c reductase iron-sulfur subunit